jgi:hypothetical protein
MGMFHTRSKISFKWLTDNAINLGTRMVRTMHGCGAMPQHAWSRLRAEALPLARDL